VIKTTQENENGRTHPWGIVCVCVVAAVLTGILVLVAIVAVRHMRERELAREVDAWIWSQCDFDADSGRARWRQILQDAEDKGVVIKKDRAGTIYGTLAHKYCAEGKYAAALDMYEQASDCFGWGPRAYAPMTYIACLAGDADAVKRVVAMECGKGQSLGAQFGDAALAWIAGDDEGVVRITGELIEQEDGPGVREGRDWDLWARFLRARALDRKGMHEEAYRALAADACGKLLRSVCPRSLASEYMIAMSGIVERSGHPEEALYILRRWSRERMTEPSVSLSRLRGSIEKDIRRLEGTSTKPSKGAEGRAAGPSMQLELGGAVFRSFGPGWKPSVAMASATTVQCFALSDRSAFPRATDGIGRYHIDTLG
jgi:hypothetical protein